MIILSYKKTDFLFFFKMSFVWKFGIKTQITNFVLCQTYKVFKYIFTILVVVKFIFENKTEWKSNKKRIF